MKITIITFAWPPRNSIGAHRPYSWAKYWSQEGISIRVITAKKYSYDEPLDLDLPPLAGVEIIEIDYAKITLFNSLIKILLKRFPKLLHKLYKNVGWINNPRDKWLDAAKKYVPILSKDTDIIVSTYDPKATHQIAALFKEANPKIFWCADYRDLWSLNHSANLSENQIMNEVVHETLTVSKYADMVSSVSNQLALKQGNYVKKPFTTIYNGFDSSLENLISNINSYKNTRKIGSSLKIVYTGKIYNNQRNPTSLLEELWDLERNQLIPNGSITLHIYGDRLDGMRNLSSDCRYKNILKIHGYVSQKVAMEVQKKADILLLLESPDPEANGVLTGKLYEYMSSGVPIISLGSSPGSAIDKILHVTGAGICLGYDRFLIRSVLLDFFHNKKFDWYKPNTKKIMTFSREHQALKFLNILINNLNKGGDYII